MDNQTHVDTGDQFRTATGGWLKETNPNTIDLRIRPHLELALVASGRSGGALYPVPPDEAFEDGDWFDGGDIAGIALELIERHPTLFSLAQRFTVDYRWKRKGGESGGKYKLGMCVKVGGLVKAYVPHLHFVIWLAADNCRDQEFTQHQIEALIFHELLHIGATDKGKPAIVPHDLEAFTREVREYGLWKSDVQRMGEAFQQLSLAVA